MKNRYFFEIAFNGSNYHGWQKQPNQITVQEVCNEKISVMLGEDINCHGCGRTDAGVHATKFLFHFDTPQLLDYNFAYKLNSFFPQDIKMLKMYGLKKRIHARYDALSRTYEYLISHGKSPFLPDMTASFHENFDMGLMNEACSILLKYNDFETFSKSNNSHSHYLCDLYEASWREEKELLIFRISANRFVRSMVRLIVGTLLEIGKQKISIEEFKVIIESKDRTKAGKSVPAYGLYLVDVAYPEGVFKEFLPV